MIKLEELKPYIAAKSDLIPLHVWNKKTARIVPTTGEKKIIDRGKTPIDLNWTKAENKNIDRALEYAKKGHNVGYRLGPHDLVIDVDPKNFSKDFNSLKKLNKFLGVKNINEIAPCVLTGGGGYHYYFKIPEGCHFKEILEKLPGIEFKTQGRQVVAAGSRHPNGKYYEWDDFGLLFRQRQMAPKKLLKLLTYTPVIDVTDDIDLISNESLAALLDQLPTEEYKSHDDWLRIMLASHHATGGAGIEEFVDWCLNDIEYADDESMIRYRWDSIHSQKHSLVTVKSLYKEVLARGGDTDTSNAEEDFADVDEVPKEDADIWDLPPAKRKENTNDEFDDIFKGESDLKSSYRGGIATELAAQLSPRSEDTLIASAIRAALQAGTYERIKAFNIIQKKLELTKGQLNQITNEVKDKLENDLGRTLANKTLELEFHEGKGLIYAGNDQFWTYTGTHWEPVTRKYIEGRVLKVVDRLKATVELGTKESTLVSEAASILGAMVAKRGDALRFKKKPYPIINCKNGELWLSRSGKHKLKPHRPESCCLQVLDVEYKPGAECPQFDKAIRETFSNFDDCEDIVRHFEEFMGYVIQPDKDIASWWLFKGPGGDGKSTLMTILCALLGDAVLPESIDRFKVGMGGDNHIMERLVGSLLVYDDDLDKSAELPNGPLKKISENKRLSSNPKGAKAFNFINCAVPVMLSNGFPRTKDISRGFRRRANVLPFNKKFHEEGGILHIAETIIKNELSGVLNKAIAGYKRLRERGEFKKPISSKVEEANWLKSSHAIVLFIEECIQKSHHKGDKVLLKDAYQAYIDWCVTNGVKYKDTKNRFKDDLSDLGFEMVTLAHNQRGFTNMLLVPPNAEELDSEWDDL